MKRVVIDIGTVRVAYDRSEARVRDALERELARLVRPGGARSMRVGTVRPHADVSLHDSPEDVGRALADALASELGGRRR